MVLDHIADGAGLFVVAATPLDADRLGHSDLHVVDVASVPQRLKDTVGEAQDEQILDRFFTQVVIDTIDLALFEHVVDNLVEVQCALEVVAKRLFDDDPRPSTVGGVGQTSGAEVVDDVFVGFGRGGQIKQPIAARALFGVNGVESFCQGDIPLGVFEGRSNIRDATDEARPIPSVEAGPRMFAALIEQQGAEVVVAPVTPCKPQDGGVVVEQAFAAQIVERGHEFAAGQITRRAKDDNRTRVRNARSGVPLHRVSTPQRYGAVGMGVGSTTLSPRWAYGSGGSGSGAL